MLSDFRYALRRLLKSPGFTLVAVLTLALGIGANTAIFSVVNGVLLRPLPYPQPEQLVTLRGNESAPDLADIGAQSKSFAAIGGLGIQAADYANGAEPMQLELGLVAGDFFEVLGAHAALGRTITATDDRFGGERVLVLSNGVWKNQFAADPAVIGRAITLAGQSYTVIGVLPADFRSLRGNLDVFAPIRVFYPLAAQARGAHLLTTYARLRSGVSLDTAQCEMRVIDQRLAQASPDENKDRKACWFPSVSASWEIFAPRFSSSSGRSGSSSSSPARISPTCSSPEWPHGNRR